MYSNSFSGLGITLRFYLFIFFNKAQSSICSNVEAVARCLGTCLKHTSIIVQSKRVCVTSFQPSQAMSLVCMWFFVCRAECFTGVHTCKNTVKCPPGSCVGRNEKRGVTDGTSSRCMGIKRSCVTFLPALAKNSGQWTILNYVGIVSMCEIKYRYYGLWWMDWVSQISVMSTLKTFPKWPYKEFLKRCLLRIKRSNWWKKMSVLNLNCIIFFFIFSFSTLVLKYETSVNTLAKYRQ